MGTPLPPNESDDPCTHCFGPGKTFGDAPTPRVLIMQFQGFNPGPAWDPSFEMTLLAPQYLIQLANPCEYQVFAGGVQFYLKWFAALTIISILPQGGGPEFFKADQASPCLILMSNELQLWENPATIDGLVTVTWNPGDLE